MNKRVFLISILGLILLGCEDQALLAVGQLESDRVEVIAESNEPILSISVLEGDELEAGTLILSQDSDRFEIRIRDAEANIARLQAVLDEQLAGPRQETIAATRASLDEANIEREYRARDLERLRDLRNQNLTSIESLDTAQKFLESAEARIEIVSAQLAELVAGTRQEQIDQTRAMLEQASVQLESLHFDKARLAVLAPVTGMVDSLPFEVGERPRAGDVVAVLLTGVQPYARIYVPETVRVGIQVGTRLQLQIDGVEQALAGTVRRIASEPAFTPYFALTERDRSRLSFMAEVELPELPQRLPEGMPVQVVFE